MKKVYKPFSFTVDTEEMLKEQEEFKKQPEIVLNQLSRVKLFMFVFIPLFTTISYFFDLAIALCVCISISSFLFLLMKFYYKNYTSISLVPVISIFLGFLFGKILLPPTMEIIQEIIKGSTK